LASVATALNVDASRVSAGSVEYTVKVNYEFPATITEAQAKMAVARALGMNENQVKVALSNVRRLLGRRLSSTRVDATVNTPDSTAVTSIQNRATDKAQVASAISSATGATITAEQLTATAPALGVEVVTTVAPSAGQVAAPVFDTAAITSVQQQVSSDLGVTVQVTQQTTPPGATTTQADVVNAGARSIFTSALLGAILSVATLVA